MSVRNLRPVFALLLTVALMASPNLAQSQSSPSSCGLPQPAFCDTFEVPVDNTGGNVRSGQLDGVVWGVSRAIGGSGTNFGQGLYDGWSATQLESCSGTVAVRSPNDVIVCGGQLREALDDNTDVVTLAMYPKQPFDFAGRTGTITFDVSNDTQGIHTQWPELWISDQPVPTPFTHFGSWLAAPRNGLGIRLGAMTGPGQGHSISQSCPNDEHNRWSMDSVVVSRNFLVDDQAWTGATRSQMLDCVIASSGPGDMNHVEVAVSQSQVDVFATDAGTVAPLHHIATVQNANLSFTRGLIWLEDVHYNAHKFGGQRVHTFAWDNVGFDGPVLARDVAFDIPDAGATIGSYPSQTNLGYFVTRQTPRFTIGGVTAENLAASKAALLTLNFFHYTPPSTITITVNDVVQTIPWPYPETTAGSWRTVALPVPLPDLKAGANTVQIGFDQQVVVANMDLILAGAGNVVAVPNVTPNPTVEATAIPSPAPTAEPLATATATAVPIDCQVLVQIDGQINSLSRPAAFCTDQ